MKIITIVIVLFTSIFTIACNSQDLIDWCIERSENCEGAPSKSSCNDAAALLDLSGCDTEETESCLDDLDLGICKETDACTDEGQKLEKCMLDYCKENKRACEKAIE